MPFKHSVRSYVLRQSRLTKAQAAAIDRYWVDFGIDYRDETLDLHALFNREAPRVLDIGTGMGDTTLRLARENPEIDYLAVEVHRPGIGRLLYGIAEYKLTNIRVINHDIVDVVNRQIPEESWRPSISISRTRGPRNATTNAVWYNPVSSTNSQPE